EDWKLPEASPVLLQLEPQVLRASSSQTGRVLFLDGAILGDREIEVSHWVQDQKQQEAQVDLLSGVYHFSSIEPTGKIRAEVRDPDGVLVAGGEKYLSDKAKESKSGNWTLEVRPVQVSGLSRFRSLENEKKSLPTSDSSPAHPSSLGFQQASIPGYRSFSYFDVDGSPVRVISDRLWKAWARSLDLNLETTSLHAGQVLHDLQALGDVEIEVPAPGRIIYLSSWIPDARAVQTDSQGFFLVLDLPKGRHEIIARRQGNFVARAWLQILDGENSFVELHSRTQKMQTALHVYDAWSGALQPASLDFGVYGVTTQSEALLPSTPGLGILRVRPESPEYLASWMSYREGQPQLALPLSRRSWFESFLKSQKIPVDPTKRQFIGFVPRASYTPILNTAFAYFDSQGRPSSEPVKGGGFIAWNLETLDQEMTIEFSTGRRMMRPLGESGLSSAIFSD
ncbi:MAG: hypothetical protein WCH11_05275, partial [Bdellovibrio sp.]